MMKLAFEQNVNFVVRKNIGKMESEFTSLKNKNLVRYISLAFSLILIGLDQLFKYLAIVHLSKIPTHPVIQDVFHLTYLENRGAAFGILSGKSFFLIGLTFLVIVVIVLAILLNKVKSNFLLWSFALVIGGGIGNLIDRIVRGFVVDYLDVRVIQFAVFNFADCCVVIGTILLMGYILFGDFIKKRLNKNSIESKVEEVEDV